MTAQVYAALNHVRLFYPEVTHVFYNDEGEWYYCDNNFDGPLTFSRHIDISLLAKQWKRSAEMNLPRYCLKIFFKKAGAWPKPVA